MDIKISQLTPTSSLETGSTKPVTDDTFKFTLASAISDAELSDKLTGLLNDISVQGKLLSEHMDVRDMKRYRGLVKEFLNNVGNCVELTH